LLILQRISYEAQPVAQQGGRAVGCGGSGRHFLGGGKLLIKNEFSKVVKKKTVARTFSMGVVLQFCGGALCCAGS